MPEFVDPGGDEVQRRVQPGDDFPFRNQRPDVDDADAAIVVGDFQHAMDDRLRADNAG
jgi:hypothetical protein